MDDVYKDYEGVKAINKTFAQKWLNKYYTNNSTSTTDGGKAVAYMLDSDVWNNLYKGDEADYTIGGPTLEMFIKSWNDTHSGNTQLKCDSSSGELGYKAAFVNNNLNTYVYGLAQNEFNSIYVKTDTSKAHGMWLASPSANTRKTGTIMKVTEAGMLGNQKYCDGFIGFRPIVCLNSATNLEKVNGGYEIIN